MGRPDKRAPGAPFSASDHTPTGVQYPPALTRETSGLAAYLAAYRWAANQLVEQAETRTRTRRRDARAGLAPLYRVPPTGTDGA